MPDQRARRALLLSGLAAATWSATRVTRLLLGDGSVVPAGDPHGYATIFSLVLTPALAIATTTLITSWPEERQTRTTPGVTLALSAPLAGPLALPTLVIAAAITITALRARRRRAAP